MREEEQPSQQTYLEYSVEKMEGTTARQHEVMVSNVAKSWGHMDVSLDQCFKEPLGFWALRFAEADQGQQEFLDFYADMLVKTASFIPQSPIRSWIRAP